MPIKHVLQVFAGFLFVTLLANNVYAHGGHKKPAVVMEKPASAIDSPYAIDDAEPSTGEEGDLSLSRTGLFADEPPVIPNGMESMDHKMPEVEIAKREWVSSKQKGYGTAAGITLMAGLFFVVLSFKRPLE
ncbi:hypothetical protein MNBD_NITROSPINAE05-1309 [hydrothermal vent metagenome]|uniref:Transmembrane protein n=1 Tax=hydrothermal vent metagenome TaxID=652676 RepID=A0A3B1CYC0_9ZZZZ